MMKMRSGDIVVVLNNVRSVYNVASVFRTCDAAGVSKIYLVGVTPTPLDRFGKFRKDFSKVALGAERTVPWEHFKNFGAVYKKLRKSAGGRTPYDGGYEILAVEQDRRSIPYFSYKNTNSYKYTNKAMKPRRSGRSENNRVAIILGEETKGLPRSVLDKCDKILEIPMRGEEESLNVAVAAGIVVFALATRC